MRDPRTLSQRIAADLATVDWPTPAEIRARARRRTTRTATAVSVVVVLVAVVSALVVAGRPAAPPFGPAVTPEPPLVLAIPPEALLQPDEVGVDLEAREFFMEGPSLTWMDPGLDTCVSSKQLTLTETAGFTRSQNLMRRRQSEEERRPADLVLSQRVARFRAGAAEQFVDDLRGVVAACDGFVLAAPIERNGERVQVEGRHSWTLIEGGVAGDQSLLLRSEKRVYEQSSGQSLGGPFSSLVGFVRVGDLVAVIEPHEADADGLRQFLQRAAARLCLAANPRC